MARKSIRVKKANPQTPAVPVDYTLESITGAVTVSTLSATIPGEEITGNVFNDDFETADFSHTENGASWTDANRVTVVRDDGYLVYDGGPTLVGPFPDRQWENAPATAGQHSMRFRYPANEPMSEHRFTLGGVYPSLFVSFWLRVPINFVHNNVSGSTTNNKLLALWPDTYTTDPSPRFFAGFDRGSPAGSSIVSVGGLENPQGANDVWGSELFIRYPDDQGRWMHVVFQATMNSGSGTNDGIARMWRRWEDVPTHNLIVEATDMVWNPVSGGNAGWTNGYVLGWANSWYAENTEFLVDDFKVSTTSLLP